MFLLPDKANNSVLLHLLYFCKRKVDDHLVINLNEVLC